MASAATKFRADLSELNAQLLARAQALSSRSAASSPASSLQAARDASLAGRLAALQAGLLASDSTQVALQDDAAPALHPPPAAPLSASASLEQIAAAVRRAELQIAASDLGVGGAALARARNAATVLQLELLAAAEAQAQAGGGGAAAAQRAWCAGGHP